MIEAILIIMMGFAPVVFSLLMTRRAEARAREQLRNLLNAPPTVPAAPYSFSLPADYQYVEGVGYLLGDITCRFNARSAHLRCAVNPLGPCEVCRYYESIPLD